MIKQIKYNRIVTLLKNVLGDLETQQIHPYTLYYYNSSQLYLIEINNIKNEIRVKHNRIINNFGLDKEQINEIVKDYYNNYYNKNYKVLSR